MEALEDYLETFCTDASAPEESDVMLQLFGTDSFMSAETNHQVLNLETPSMYWPDHDVISSSCYSSSSSTVTADLVNAGLCQIGQGGCGSGGYYYLTCPNSADAPESNCNSSFTLMELLLDEPACFAEETSNYGSTESHQDQMEMFPLSGHYQRPFPPKRRVEMVETSLSDDNEEDTIKFQTSKHVHKKKKKTQPKRTQKSKKDSETGNDSQMVIKQQPSSSCISEEDESCESQENIEDGNGRIFSRSKGSKPRSERGEAVDPQSLYARKRRERINERLRILQKMVPNGTKVDISTMLEEAVQYVKFLQVQIKLLSSDELWMYAPIAYNGMNLGLDLKIAQQL